MKSLNFIALAFLLCRFGVLCAQAPQGIPYQAVARTAQGDPVVNASVQVRFSLREQTANGTISYQEAHALTTNDLGLFATVFGTGTTSVGTFSGINWSQTVKFLQVEISPGQGWSDMGTQQLMSVPYALYAANGGSAGYQFRAGSTLIPQGLANPSITIIFNQPLPSANYFISITKTNACAGTNYSETWVSNKTANGFTITAEYVTLSLCPQGLPLDWIAVH